MIVYKYFPPERQCFLDNLLIRFTQPSELNDPFECIPFVPEMDIGLFVDEIINRQRKPVDLLGSKKEKRLFKQRVPALRASLRQKYKNDPNILADVFLGSFLEETNHKDRGIGILSLSRRWDSGLMWGHYGKSHQGFCVGFKNEHSFFNHPDGQHPDIGLLRKVHYSKVRVVATIAIGEHSEVDFDPLYTKCSDWEYEQEERLIRVLADCNQRVSRVDQPDVCLFNIPKDAIAEVIVGAKAPDDLKTKLKTFANELSIPFYKARVSRRDFDMERLEE
ncbi:MAG: DUF2971 domain-containing protein [Verrucomicrobiales bacterium]